MKIIPRMDIGEFDYERHDKGMKIVMYMDRQDVSEAILNYAIGWEDGDDIEINNEGTYAILFQYKKGIHWFHVPKRIIDIDLLDKVKLGDKNGQTN